MSSNYYAWSAGILRRAVGAVRAVSYALGVAGIVAVIAIERGFRLGLDTAVLVAVVMFVLMTELVLFARLSSIASAHFRMPALIFIWFFLILTIASATLLFSHVSLGIPGTLNLWQQQQREASSRPMRSIRKI
jgi:hypothetical protein